MINTAFFQKHLELGAKLIPFAGFNMPVSYKGIKIEHQTVRNGVGVFDVSHMGEFWVEGKDATAFLQYTTSNDVASLFDGKVQYSCMPNGKGGIVDDLLVYRLHEQKYLLVVNASNIEKDFNWLLSHVDNFDVRLINDSENFSLLAVQGPMAAQALQALTPINLMEMPYYTFKTGEFAGIENIIVSATGYTGAGGFEIYIPNQYATAVWDAIFDAGKAFDIAPIGLGARDTLRLEMGFCLYGNDIDDTTSPLEAGLGWITKFNKQFIDCDLLLNQKQHGLKKKLVAFEMIDKGIPRKDYPICDANGTKLGLVTSGSESPTTQKLIGMGYVQIEHSKIGNLVYIEIRNKLLTAKIVKLPFI